VIIIGCDIHTRMEHIAMLDTETGEVVEKRLEHENGEAKRFYEGLKGRQGWGSRRRVTRAGLRRCFRSCGTSWWWARRARSARSGRASRSTTGGDAEDLLNLLLRGDFPKVWLPPPEERDVRVLIEHRHQLVELRTRPKNGLQAMALSYGLRQRGRLWSERGQEELK